MEKLNKSSKWNCHSLYYVPWALLIVSHNHLHSATVCWPNTDHRMAMVLGLTLTRKCTEMCNRPNRVSLKTKMIWVLPFAEMHDLFAL